MCIPPRPTTPVNLDEAIRAGGFVLLTGESTAGKSRAAYEAMRRLLPDHLLIAPATRESVTTIVDVVLEHRRCVVWLDDIERFLGTPGLTAPTVTRILTSGALLLGTIRAAELDRFRARRESELDPRNETAGALPGKCSSWLSKSRCHADGARGSWLGPEHRPPIDGSNLHLP